MKFPPHARSGHSHTVITGGHARLYDRVLVPLVMGGLYRSVAAEVVGDLPEGGTFLDIGTGPGQLLVEVGRRRPDVRLAGIDPSDDMVEVARRRIRDAGLTERSDVQVAGAESMPFETGSVDVAMSTLSGHHWADLGMALAEQARVLRPGGRLWACDLRGTPSANLEKALRASFPAAEITRPGLGRVAGMFVTCHRVVT